MAPEPIPTAEDDDDIDGDLDGDRAGYLKYLPTVTFGLRAAALAGIVVSVGAANVDLSGLFTGAGHHLIAGWPGNGGQSCSMTIAMQ